MTRIEAIVVAAGRGVRAGGDQPKQFIDIGGTTPLMLCVKAMAEFCDLVVVVLPGSHIHYWDQLCKEYHFTTAHTVVEGGDTRFDSVKNGVAAISSTAEIVLVHDGVRPFVSGELIERVVDGVKLSGAVVPVIPVIDSLRRIDGGVISRASVMAVQTPQGFAADIIRRSYGQGYQKHFTDDASVVEANGYWVEMVEGEVLNFKITTSFDLIVAKTLIKQK